MGYPGSKGQAGTFQCIIGQMPPHSVYVEPFFGSGVVFWRKRRAASSIVIDKAQTLIVKVSAEPGVRAIRGDALELLPELLQALPADAVVYCDPPYCLALRQQRVYYDHELTDAQHWTLLTMLQRAECRVLISGYPTEFYGAALQNWRCLRYQTRTRGKTVAECLWCNFPEPEELHDWRYAGRNFRERLAYKRVARRWLAKLDAMPGRKRGYVLDAISQRWKWRGGPAPEMKLAGLSVDSDHSAPRASLTRSPKQIVFTGLRSPGPVAAVAGAGQPEPEAPQLQELEAQHGPGAAK